MIRKSFTLGLLAIVPLLLAINSYSQDVRVKLFQPSPNQWNVADMWNLILTNTSSESIKVYLHGTVEAQRDGKIFDGKSAVFELPANYSGRIDPRQLEPANVGYANSEYEEIVLRTGTMPEGVYSICITVYDAKSEQELASDCVDQPITSISPPELLNPVDEAELTEPFPVFTWSPPTPLMGNYSVSYRLRIVELLDGQIPLEAMEANPAWFTEKNIPFTSFQLPISARPFEPGKSFAWQVAAFNEKQQYEIGKSEVWGFSKTKVFLKKVTLAAECSKTEDPWMVGGNELKTDNFYLGTCNEYPLALGTNKLEKMRILTNGKVGIGTAEPNYRLHLHSDSVVPLKKTTGFDVKEEIKYGKPILPGQTPEEMEFQTFYVEPAIPIREQETINVDPGIPEIESKKELSKGNKLLMNRATGYSMEPKGFVTFQMTNSTTGQDPDVGLRINLYGNDANINLNQPGSMWFNVPGGNIQLRAYNGTIIGHAKEYWFKAGGSGHLGEGMVIKNNGNIGIGILNPHQRLEIKGNVSVYGAGSSLVFGKETIASNSDAWGQWAIEYNKDSQGLNFWKPFGSSKFGNYYLFLHDNGNVLIGKSTQENTAYKLDVQGSIRANEIVVNLTGADFVFDDKYSLMSLDELEKNIKENKHLPDVPSAGEMQTNGMPLGEMSTLLLQKIEELTLYLIELKKENERLKDRVSKIEKR